MPDGNDKRLTKEFQEFSFGDDPKAPADDPKKPVPYTPPAPRELTKDDLDFIPYNPDGNGRRIPVSAMDEDRIAQEEDLAWEERRQDEEMEERAFEAAGVMFRKNRKVHSVLELLENLEIEGVISAGLIDAEFRGRLPDERVNNMMIASLCLNAVNFDDICGKLPPETVGMVDEVLMMVMEPEKELRHLHAASLEPDSKRLMLARSIGEMEMALHEMHEFGWAGPEKPQHDDMGEMIQALAGGDGADKGLLKRAIAAYNVISTATDNGSNLKMRTDGSVVLNAHPDIEIKAAPAEPAHKKQNKPKRNPGRGF